MGIAVVAGAGRTSPSPQEKPVEATEDNVTKTFALVVVRTKSFGRAADHFQHAPLLAATCAERCQS